MSPQVEMSRPFVCPYLPISPHVPPGGDVSPVRLPARPLVRRARHDGAAPTSPHISPRLPTSPLVSPHLPTSPHISPHLPTSPHISSHLPTSPHISPHLPTSPHISAPGPRLSSLVHEMGRLTYSSSEGRVQVRGNLVRVGVRARVSWVASPTRRRRGAAG